MLGNGIKQTTATTGTGNLTLAAVADYPKLSDVVPLLFPVAYSLVDSNGSTLEQGIGHLTDASTFVRSAVTAVYSGGVYLGGPAGASAPSAANLTGTTTLIVTPHAATVESMMPTVDRVSASVIRYLTSAARNQNFTPASINPLKVYYVPFLLRCAAPIASLAINVTTLASGATARAGIYTVNENGYPGILLATTGDIDVSNTGQKMGTLSNPIMLPPGWYFVALVSSSNPSLTSYASGASNMIGTTPFGLSSVTTSIDFRSETVASAVLPATPSQSTSASNTGANHIPIVYLGVQ